MLPGREFVKHFQCGFSRLKYGSEEPVRNKLLVVSLEEDRGKLQLVARALVVLKMRVRKGNESEFREALDKVIKAQGCVSVRKVIDDEECHTLEIWVGSKLA